MEQDILQTILLHAQTITCAAVGGFAICCAYWYTVEPRQRVTWLPLVLLLLAVTTALIISVIKGSIALSLGLIGALSIARFRTRISDPRILALILVTIAIGVGSGAGELLLTTVGTVFVVGLIAVFYSPGNSVPAEVVAPKIVAHLSFLGRDPVSIAAVSGYLTQRHARHSIRNMSRKEGETTLTVHLHDCELGHVDQLVRDMADVFPEHQCACELQVKSAPDGGAENDGAAAKSGQTAAPPAGVRVPDSVAGRSS